MSIALKAILLFPIIIVQLIWKYLLVFFTAFYVQAKSKYRVKIYLKSGQVINVLSMSEIDYTRDQKGKITKIKYTPEITKSHYGLTHILNVDDISAIIAKG